MFDYKLIEAFAAVIMEGGFDKGARKLFITQSAVSQRVKLLEEEFGQILLLRRSPPEPTDFGKKILGLYNQVSRLENDLLSTKAIKENARFTSLPIGINADSLASWFYPAVESFLKKNKVVLDLLVDDQEETHRFLKDGQVLGCISTREKAAQGCVSRYLGIMHYGLFCSPWFREKYFPEEISKENIGSAPMISYNRKDGLNISILQNTLGIAPEEYSTHYIPSPELFLRGIISGIGYGAIPLQQYDQPLRQGLLVDLFPEYKEEVPLYFHCWNIDSVLLQSFSDQIISGFAGAGC